MAHPHAGNLCCVHLFLIVLEPIWSKGNRICRAWMETRIIPDEDMADAATTKKVAEIFFEYLSEMYLQFGLTLLSDIFIYASV
ncbi:hypothetical protein PIB30_041708 [Stylosanthes scabra]|uniref:Uncharacterized protein n=1 Tax=Stylosanthes scabra TaxID=79078 RepID=A0ABU6WG42_9FABA|nr:hypothetical protein [Stylosanthes scabra]